MKNIYCIVLLALTISSCENKMPGFRFSNFNDSPVENLAKAVKQNNINKIKEEVISKKVNINFLDEKYKWPLLSLAVANHKKEAFKTLLELGANPNLYGSNCESPLILAIKWNNNCDLYYIKTLIEYDADLTPGFFNQCNFSHDPLLETILHFNDDGEEKCCIDIMKLLINKMEKIDLNKFNDSKNHKQSIISFCLETRNMNALKYFIVDLKYKVPDKIYVDGTVLPQFKGYTTLKKVLLNKFFVFNHSKSREKAKNEILTFLDKFPAPASL